MHMQDTTCTLMLSCWTACHIGCDRPELADNRPKFTQQCSHERDHRAGRTSNYVADAGQKPIIHASTLDACVPIAHLAVHCQIQLRCCRRSVD